MGHIFLHLCMLANLLLNPKHCKCHVLKYRPLLFYFSIVELWSGIQIECLGSTGITFWILLLSFVGRTQGNLYSVGTLRSEDSSPYSVFGGPSILAGKNMNPVWSPVIVPLAHSSDSFSVILSSSDSFHLSIFVQPQIVSSCSYAVQDQPNTPRDNSAGCWSSVSLWSSLLSWKL